MELFELQNLINSNECPSVLIFLGEDYMLANLYIENIAKRYNLVRTDVDTLQDVIRGSSKNEFNFENKLFVIKHQKDIISKENLWSKVGDKLKKDMLIYVYNDLDKRTKFYTQNKDKIVNFSPQEEKTFLAMVKCQTKMSSANIKELSKICNFNYGKFLSELNKIKCYSEQNGVSEDDSYVQLINSGTIYTGDKDVVFEFVNKVMSAKIDMYDQYITLRNNGESNILIISLLYTSMRNQFICQTVSNPSQSSTGLTPYVINTCLRRNKIYSVSDLRKAMKLVKKLEQGVKMGLFDESFIVDYFLAELLL